jgi:Photosynthetic reaction centre cytochrome C subunit
MTRSLRLLLVLSLSTAAFAQTPTPPPGGQAPPAGQARRPIPAPSNLKVLPRDMSGEQVIAIMRGFVGQLGVECGYCHAKDPATGRNNFASDANPMKDRARVMMKMTASIDTDFLPQLTDPKPGNPVTCGTCHQGMSKPPVFVPKPEEHGPRPAAPSPPTPQ